MFMFMFDTTIPGIRVSEVTLASKCDGALSKCLHATRERNIRAPDVITNLLEVRRVVLHGT